MTARHEYKHILNHADYLVLRSRLRAVLPHDAHTNEQGEYLVRSLYFDTPNDKALREKIDGVNDREKFRLRFYNGNPSFLRLEKKAKHNGLCYKDSACLSAEEAQRIVDGDWQWMRAKADPLFHELYVKHQGLMLAPKTVVEYVREPFIFVAGNVRITLDSQLRTGLSPTDFLCPSPPLLPAGDTPALLEVKYDAFIPRHIIALLQIGNRQATAFSKYALCRMYG